MADEANFLNFPEIPVVPRLVPSSLYSPYLDITAYNIIQHSFTVPKVNELQPGKAEPQKDYRVAHEILTVKGKRPVGYAVAFKNTILLFNLAGEMVACLEERDYGKGESTLWRNGIRYRDKNGLEVEVLRYPRIPSYPEDKEKIRGVILSVDFSPKKFLKSRITELVNF